MKFTALFLCDDRESDLNGPVIWVWSPSFQTQQLQQYEIHRFPVFSSTPQIKNNGLNIVYCVSELEAEVVLFIFWLASSGLGGTVDRTGE